MLILLTRFTLDDKKTSISVVQYFHQKYNIVVKHPNLPCLQSGSESKPVYLPMEVKLSVIIHPYGLTLVID